MPQESPSPDRYRKRREAGDASRADTRQRLLTAARDLFSAKGYAATTVSELAAAADVSVQTLYLAWGSKRALLAAAADAASGETGGPMTSEDWCTRVREEVARSLHPSGGHPTARHHVTAVVRLLLEVAERASDLRRVQYEASATEPEVARDVAATTERRRAIMYAIAEQIPPDGLRPGLDVTTIGDTLWALGGPEVYELMHRGAGRDPQRIGAWLEQVLVGSLCQDSER